jgi:hypothetical protein
VELKDVSVLPSSVIAYAKGTFQKQIETMPGTMVARTAPTLIVWLRTIAQPIVIAYDDEVNWAEDLAKLSEAVRSVHCD